MHQTNNEAKVKNDIDVIETINIELEHSVAKLLAENEKLHKENEHLKQTYKDLYDSIKKTRVQTKDHNDSLIAQINSKTVENADLRAQIQKKILTRHRFSPNKSSVVYEQTSPRSCLRWKPTGKIFNNVRLRWVPTGKIFTSSTTKVDSQPPNGSKEDITSPYECDQTLNVSADTLNLSAGPAPQFLTPGYISSCLMQNLVSSTSYVPSSKKDYDILCQPFNPSSTIIVQDVPSVSTSLTTQEIQSLVIHQGVEEQIQGIQNAQFDNEPLRYNLTSDSSFEESSSQGIIPSNVYQLNQSFDNLSKWPKDHPLENVIEVTEKQSGNVQTSLTMLDAELEIQSMVDIPIHPKDPVVQRTLLIDTVILMVTKKTTSTPTPLTTQAQVQMCSTSCWKDSSREAWNALLVQGNLRWATG
ncbi:hypothetical protein Tco_1245980 [Tanacetum coccineum]